MLIARHLQTACLEALNAAPALALLGPRQVGKTTLALELVKTLGKPGHYLDLELDSDLAKLDDAEAYLRRFEGQLLVIDEVQRKPDLFRVLRSLIDQRMRGGELTGHFLLLGSASKDLIQDASESLAGRIRYLELSPFSADELHKHSAAFSLENLWLRGGFPDSYLASSDKDSWQWRSNFIATYVEKDIPLMGPNISTMTLRRLWAMLAHNNGQQVNLSRLGESLGVSYKTVRNYIDTLTDFYMLRQIQPWAGNAKKRLVKAPKIYLRDSGLLHCFLNISDMETLLGHPGIGASWETIVIENILNQCSTLWRYSYYRSTAQAEVDLVLEGPRQQVWAIEIKRSSSPTVSKGFHYACEDVGATRRFVIYPGTEMFPLSQNVEVMCLIHFLTLLEQQTT